MSATKVNCSFHNHSQLSEKQNNIKKGVRYLAAKLRRSQSEVGKLGLWKLIGDISRSTASVPWPRAIIKAIRRGPVIRSRSKRGKRDSFWQLGEPGQPHTASATHLHHFNCEPIALVAMRLEIYFYLYSYLNTS